MKKYLFAALATLGLLFNSCFACCQVAPFKKSSFYLGAGVGSTFLNYHTVITEPPFAKINTPIYGNGFLGNIQGGYQWTHCLYSLSIDGFVNGTTQQTGMNAIYGPTGDSRRMQFRNNWNAGISLLPGYLLNDYMIAYLRVGYINSHYTANVKGGGSRQFTTDLPGADVGLGGEVWFPMLRNFSVRGEFDSIISPSWNRIGAFNSTTGLRNNAKVHVSNNLFQINFIYHFV